MTEGRKETISVLRFCSVLVLFFGGGYIVSFVSIVSIEEGHFLIFLV